MNVNKFFDMVIWWPRSHGHDVFIGPCGLISFHRILLENSQWAFLMLSWTSKEKSRKAFWKPFGRPTQENGRLISCSPIEKKRVYFVHWCMKILAKRKRGNKFPLEGKCIFGQLRENKWGNKSKDLHDMSWTSNMGRKEEIGSWICDIL